MKKDMKQTLKNFALTEDYAYCTNAGIMYANDQNVREEIAQMIEDAQYVTKVDSDQCADLEEEAANGCEIYRVGLEPDTLHIAYYE